MRFAPLAAALLLALPAGSFAQGPLRPNCQSTDPGQPCRVVITMSAGCGSGIKVAPDPIVVPRRTVVHIEWVIETQGWQFDSPGIFIHQGEKVFDPVDRSAKKVKIKNKNPEPGAFKYDVLLKDEDNRPCRLDPTVVNQ